MKFKLSLFAGALALCGMTTLSQASNVSITTDAISGLSDWSDGANTVAATYLTVNGGGNATITMNGVPVIAQNYSIGGGTPLNPSTPASVSFSLGGLNFTITGVGTSHLSGNYYGYGDNGGPGGNLAWWDGLGSNSQTTNNFQHILSGAIYAASPGVGGLGGAGSPATSMTLTIDGLNSGTTYVVRFFTYSQESGGGLYSETISADGVTSAAGNVIGNNAPNDSSYFLATFTANAATETFTIDGVNGPAVLSAFEIDAVPEPSTVAFLSMAAGLLGLMAVRRRGLAVA